MDLRKAQDQDTKYNMKSTRRVNLDRPKNKEHETDQTWQGQDFVAKMGRLGHFKYLKCGQRHMTSLFIR